MFDFTASSAAGNISFNIMFGKFAGTMCHPRWQPTIKARAS
jgi:hypothetical protein